MDKRFMSRNKYLGDGKAFPYWRYGADSTLIASKIAMQTRVLCASSDYLNQAGFPASLEEIASHHLIDKIHGADLLCWSLVIGHPARENIRKPLFNCDDF